MKKRNPKPPLIVISAPAGTGKTTLVNSVKQRCPFLRQTISCTSRAPRRGEKEGVDYFFISKGLFEEAIAREQLLEWVELFGEYYGTLRSQVEQLQGASGCAILVIDVQGALKLKRQLFCSTIFIVPPSRAELKRRLVERGTESLEKIEQRLERARCEMAQAERFDHRLVNDNFQTASSELERIIRSEAANFFPSFVPPSGG